MSRSEFLMDKRVRKYQISFRRPKSIKEHWNKQFGMVDKKVENEAGIINCGRVIIANVKEYTVLGEKPHSERNRARRKHRAPRVSP